ncbi:MAG: hypothetical protein ACSLFP_01845, partial [Acidimicrobiales bacterium]
SPLPPPPPPPPWAVAPGAPPGPPARRWPAALGVVAAGLTVLGAVALLAGPDDDGHPGEWDPRVAELAAFVEDERGLRFDHPVHVDFLSADDYTEATTTADEEVLDEDREELDRYAGQLRALGVASGELDLFEAFNQVSDGGTLAFYDPFNERVRVRGTEMTVGLEVTIVHELTHALQDQHFDLEGLFDSELDDGAATAYRALIEGDALRVEDAYVADELTAAQQEQYDEEFGAELDASVAATADVPPFVSAVVSAPYALGRPFVLMLFNEGGNATVDDAFDRRPTTEEHLLDPLSFLRGDEGEELDLDPDEELDAFDDGPFGAIGWFLFLAERIDPKVAFDAAVGWGGDGYVAYEADDAICVRAAFVGDTSADEAEMAAALDTWQAAMPGDRSDPLDVDGHPGIETCDPGTEADLALTGRSEDSLFLPSLWGYLVADATSVLEPTEADCYARGVLAGLEYDEITDPEGTVFGEERFQQLTTDALAACR